MIKKLCTLLALAVCLNVGAQIITTVVGNGTAGYSGDGGQAINAELNYPEGIAFDAIGNMYIADFINHRIRKITTSGIISTIAGNGTGGYSGDGGQATAAELNRPNSIIFDLVGNLYICDAQNNRIRMINTSGIISTIAGGGTSGLGDGGQATSAELAFPQGIAFDPLSNLYISDDLHDRIRMVNTSGIITTVAGNGTSGYSGDGGQATAAQLNSPFGLVFDGTGNLLIADYDNNRVRMINTLGIISTIVGNGIGAGTFPCSICYGGDGGQATAAGLYLPSELTFDMAGNLYIADTYNNRIRMINTLGIITTIVGSGTPPYNNGYSGDGGQATAAKLYDPYGIALDASGNLYIADYGNLRVRKVTNVGQAGIEQVANNNTEVNIYPNPNNGSFIIEPQNTLYNVHCTVYDINGKAVLSQTINGKTTIDASSLNEGVYNISLQSNEGVVNKRVVIVR